MLKINRPSVCSLGAKVTCCRAAARACEREKATQPRTASRFRQKHDRANLLVNVEDPPPHRPGRARMTDSLLFHEGNRRLQDQFGSRQISDRLERFSRTQFTADDRTFVESAPYFFLATADAKGSPDCSFKGGMPGFVRVTGPSELAFPDYDGNGMFKSLGNI